MSDPNETQQYKIKRETDFLSVPESDHMAQRRPRPGTTMLGAGWQLLFKMDDHRQYLDIKEKILIGRDVDGTGSVDFDLNDFGAYHFGVSRVHAMLNVIDGLIYLEDNNSTNGTRINGFQLTPHQQYRLRDGDELEFGRLHLKMSFVKPE